MPRPRQFPLPSFLPVGRARGRHCPRPRRVIRRAVRLARLRATLSALGVIGVIGAAAAGGFWFAREPVLAAGADALLAAESLFMAEGAAPSAAQPAAPAAVVEAGTPSPIRAVLVR